VFHRQGDWSHALGELLGRAAERWVPYKDAAGVVDLDFLRAALTGPRCTVRLVSFYYGRRGAASEEDWAREWAVKWVQDAGGEPHGCGLCGACALGHEDDDEEQREPRGLGRLALYVALLVHVTAGEFDSDAYVSVAIGLQLARQSEASRRAVGELRKNQEVRLFENKVIGRDLTAGTGTAAVARCGERLWGYLVNLGVIFPSLEVEAGAAAPEQRRARVTYRVSAPCGRCPSRALTRSQAGGARAGRAPRHYPGRHQIVRSERCRVQRAARAARAARGRRRVGRAAVEEVSRGCVNCPSRPSRPCFAGTTGGVGTQA
jgi:hypothetical protein